MDVEVQQTRGNKMVKTGSSIGRVKAQRQGSFKRPDKKVEAAPKVQRDYALADKRDFINNVPIVRKGEKSAYFVAYLIALITGANRVAVK